MEERMNEREKESIAKQVVERVCKRMGAPLDTMGVPMWMEFYTVALLDRIAPPAPSDYFFGAFAKLEGVLKNITLAIARFSDRQQKAQRQKVQRQDSLTAQLRDLVKLANREGMYDAADFIKNQVLAIHDTNARRTT
jgi:hypothetical protein